MFLASTVTSSDNVMRGSMTCIGALYEHSGGSLLSLPDTPKDIGNHPKAVGHSILFLLPLAESLWLTQW
jgi:hypothetical protein